MMNQLNVINKRIVMLLLCTACVLMAQAQDASSRKNIKEITTPTLVVKSNLLYDATTTLNLGFEVKLAPKWTLDVPVNYNPWTFSENRKWRHLLVQPELRYWSCQAFNGSFWGIHAHYGMYNVGGLKNPPFSEYMNQHRFQGWLAGAGISYGYHWIFSPRWSLEATVGAGYAFLDYDRYECVTCGELLGKETKHYFGPTKAGISLIYTIK